MKAFINSISYYLPHEILSNKDLEKRFPEWSVEKVANKVGILQRHVADKNETAGDMAIKAANCLFEEHSINKETIDFILFCTQSPDYFLPTTSCIIQNKLGLQTKVGALDFNLGCSGYVYGLSLSKGLICAGIAKNVLLLTSETYSKYIHSDDKGNQSIFGDGATATLISDSGFAEIKNFVLGTDGSGAENLIVRNGCSRNNNSGTSISYDESGYLVSPDHLYMNGSAIFNFTIDAIPSLINATLVKNKLVKSDVDLFLFHQANKFMLNTLRKVCAIDPGKFYVDMEDIGNTVSSTIPIALARINKSGGLKVKSKTLLAGFGVGYSWGGCILEH